MLGAPAKAEGEHQELVLSALDDVLRSKSFSGSPRLSQFLRHTVEHTLRGELTELKEICIGMAVFGKAASYDPKEEPIVRVEARRLRARLDEYYSLAGKNDPVRIHLPKGGYLATFEEMHATIAAETEPPAGELPRIVVEPRAAVNIAAIAAPLTEGSPPVADRRPGGSARILIIVMVSLIAFSAGIVAMLLSRMSNPKVLHFEHITPLTSYPGNEMQPAISHDGRQFAFVWGGEKGDNYDIYVKLLDLGTPVRLTIDAAHDLAPRWAPDDRFLSFIRVSEQGMGVFVLPALGGAERKIAEINMPSAWKADGLQVQVGSGAAWSADGTQLIVTDEEVSHLGTAALYAIPLDGSPRRRITSPPNLAHDFNAVVAHNGREIAFVRETSNSSGDLFLSDMDGSHLRRITFDQMRIRGVAWTPGDRALVFSSNRGGADELWQVSANGGAPQRIAAKGYEVAYPSLSSDGSMLAYTSTAQNWNIWRVPASSPGAPAAAPQILIASSGRNNSPRYSPDGKNIAFISDRSGAWELWVADSEGHGLRQLTSFEGPMVGTPNWSPDSRYLVFDARPKGRSVIFTVALNGGSPQPVIDDGFENKKPSWSRDRQSIYYTSNRNGPSQLWRSGLHGEHPTRLTTEVCNDNAESPDGRYVYFQNDGNGVYRIPVAGGKPELVKGLENVYPSRYFDVLDQIYYLDQENLPRTIRQYDPESHRISTIGTISSQLVYGTPSLSISPDHRYILFAQQDSSSSEIMALRK